MATSLARKNLVTPAYVSRLISCKTCKNALIRTAMCSKGHTFCVDCGTNKKYCTMCKEKFTMRNYQVEALVALIGFKESREVKKHTTVIKCPKQYCSVKTSYPKMNAHLQACHYRSIITISRKNYTTIVLRNLTTPRKERKVVYFRKHFFVVLLKIDGKRGCEVQVAKISQCSTEFLFSLDNKKKSAVNLYTNLNKNENVLRVLLKNEIKLYMYKL